VLGLALWLIPPLPALWGIWFAYGTSGLIALLALSKIGDTAGYYVGGAIGKSHPFPRISPGKTTAGCVASLVAATALAACCRRRACSGRPLRHRQRARGGRAAQPRGTVRRPAREPRQATRGREGLLDVVRPVGRPPGPARQPACSRSRWRSRRGPSCSRISRVDRSSNPGPCSAHTRRTHRASTRSLPLSLTEITIPLKSHDEAILILGPYDRYAKILRQDLDIEIFTRRGNLRLRGTDEGVQEARRRIDHLLGKSRKGRELALADIEAILLGTDTPAAAERVERAPPHAAAQRPVPSYRVLRAGGASAGERPSASTWSETESRPRPHLVSSPRSRRCA
jgi:hypothetical protein